MKRDIKANIGFCYYFVSLHALAALNIYGNIWTCSCAIKKIEQN